eukprot:c20471_g3_i2.p1 GENE.c20471_g3_i2~~c20471_g3_i2.p1  ORF type:complete len:545 (-),score=252.45 c20471_g3_i2:10-1644(-)
MDEVDILFARRLCSPRRKRRLSLDDSCLSDLVSSPSSTNTSSDPQFHFRKSLSPKKNQTSGDRYIPLRSDVDFSTHFSLLNEAKTLPSSPPSTPTTIVTATTNNQQSIQVQSQGFPTQSTETTTRGEDQTQVYNYLLRSRFQVPTASTPSPVLTEMSSEGRRGLFQYNSSPPPPTTRSPTSIISPLSSPTRTSNLSSPPLRRRSSATSTTKVHKISSVPYKILDAPNINDDFYLNLIDWSSNNILAVALGSSVFLWNAYTGKVTKTYQAPVVRGVQEYVSGLCWAEQGNQLAIGTSFGTVDIIDTNLCKRLRSMTGHTQRVGTLCWNDSSLCSGSRDRSILIRDPRSNRPFEATLSGHKQEICGLRWSPDGKYLASGGNDNKLLLWSPSDHTRPIYRYAEHTAAVKAIAWSPHESGIFVSGGGTADRTLRFWNVNQSNSFKVVDTGSQVCNVGWSSNVNEIVSTHGYSQNQINIWKYPSMRRTATLTGHTTRVLYLGMSPDGQNIVTGAGDETLRFWHVWPHKKLSDENKDTKGLLPSSGSQIR